ncbi:RNB domain-containing ribonuclease [Knoellia subterranea]|uniref:Ribonuclease II n=1 Tax=Knoellia subterranea KCTC 19937 TaxID=1385521 RepID=A0A0A0JSH0_9MICO|nr:RNB domain-containing ribonuclease [Knoellia subterranea]KGN38992.1 ribonuclease II [Knoellia subterranea KCTC 19937]
MPQRQISLAPVDATTTAPLRETLLARFAAIRAELKVSEEFPPEVEAEATQVAGAPALPERDETAVPFVTLDPATSMDLDQAMHLEREGDGYRVRYAIADVPAFVAAGGAVDVEARRRGQTVYCPDLRIPLHPTAISEGAASLLPGETRPAFVWDMRLDAEGEGTSAEVYRAMVKSVERFDYVTLQEQFDAGTADERWLLLKEIGEKRIRQEQLRGGASLPMPEQEVHLGEDGNFSLEFRPPRAVEEWNAQISLLTGMAAADMMLHARVGILRTMPEADHNAVARFRRQAKALGTPWPAEMGYGEFLRSLDRTNPKHLALIYDATSLFRGAGYTPFDGDVPEQVEQAAVADAYAHVTAPLRRLIDRFGLVICEAISAGTEIPGWVREALPTLPEIMKESDRVAGAAERMCADAVEAAVLTPRIGETFEAVVVDRDDKGLEVQLTEVPVVARAKGHGDLGATVSVRLETADVSAGKVTFVVA